ncbi:hypothetical protein SteCoe_1535 [Stentor coeruleus]|uniref:OTU domain-containing protein n=1 Tax=Stentor coeruleus TaxID=5963 RepID=A0A1R2D1Q0_9CILI|nr:hypothetical protein SteCoe_1535 [Stentor coeruleus]
MGKKRREKHKLNQKERKTNRRERGGRRFNDQQWKTEKFKLKQQLNKFGLDIKEISGDGNCLFRAISDQITGNENSHSEYRVLAIEFMRENSEDFSPFVEDDEPFDDYIKRMSKLGTWGGNMELQALSLVLNVNIKIHRLGEPIWEITNFDRERSIHLSYHDGDHYNSVRLRGDLGDCEPIIIPEQLEAVKENERDAEIRWRTCAEFFVDTINGVWGKIESLIPVMKKFYQNPPDFEEVLEDTQEILSEVKKNENETQKSEDKRKDGQIYEEKKEVNQKKNICYGKKPSKLPNNKDKCWCGSGRIYKKCCKATDYLREVEEEKIISRMESLKI